MWIDSFEIVNLVRLVYDFVEEEACKPTLQEYSLVQSLAYYHTNELIDQSEVMRILILRQHVWVLASIDLGLDKKGELRVKDLLSKLRQEFFKEATCINTLLLFALCVNENNLEARRRIKMLVLSVHVEGVFEDRLATNAERYRLTSTSIAVFLLLDLLREDLGADSEIVDPRDILKGHLADELV